MTTENRRRPIGRLFLISYLVLLAASHLVRQIPRPVDLGEHQRIPLEVVDSEGSRTGEHIPASYLEWGREHLRQRPTVVLIHGSPGAAANFNQVGSLLAEQWHVLAPDLPGFGPLRAKVPSFSIAAHADYVDQLLTRLNIDQAHVVGFSLGGAVAIDLLDPEQPTEHTVVESLTLLAATGVQEHELFGNYAVNHAMHGLQLVGLQLIHNGIPHFGFLDDSMLGLNYARNFFDTDQRPMRSILCKLKIPTFVFHGKDDDLVPVEAALEHHRIVPQSSLELTESGHLMIFRQPDRVAKVISEFLSDVEAGTAKGRDDASAERLRQASTAPDQRSAPIEGLALVALMALIAVGTLVSEDLATIGAGLLVSDQRLGFAYASIASIVGIVSGDLMIYASGRWLGPRALRRAPLKWWLPPSRVQRAKVLFEKQGPWLIFASRFTPGTRVATYFAAGLVRTSAWRFGFYLLLAAALWVPVLVAVSAAVGEPIFGFVERFRAGGWLIALAVVGVLWWLAHNLPLLATRHGRLRFRARWERRLRWEYWPFWLIYAPLIPYCAWLAIRHRGLTFTAANQGMVDGGVLGESKSAILHRLPADSTPPFIVVEPHRDREQAERLAQTFFAEHGPQIVLKPDVGERGRKVVVARTHSDIERYLDSTGEATICQAHVSGDEFGVFWIDRPGEELGEVFSIAEKRLPTVIGDGKRTLGDLILHDPRARHHVDRYWTEREDIQEVPGDGESISLGDLGTHCRGATFIDARELTSTALRAKIGEISRAAGWGVGRYDLRVPNPEALEQGVGLSILEVNGVSGEAAHIYDPSASLFQAIRTLAVQWRKAFAVGAHRHDAGQPMMSLVGFCTRTLHLLFTRSRTESRFAPSRVGSLDDD